MTGNFFDYEDGRDSLDYDEEMEFSLLGTMMDSEEGEFNSSGTSMKSLLTDEDDSYGGDDVPYIEDDLVESLTTPTLTIKLTLPSDNNTKTKPKRPRVCRNRKRLPPKSVAHLPAIRILKSDIRRQYADMVMKVMNNYDISMFDSFLHNFCAPGFRITELIPKLSNSSIPNFIDGLENTIKSWAYCFEIMPDCVFHLYDAKFIRTLGHTGSRVVCKARLTGTKLYSATNPLLESSAEYSVMQQICAVGNNLPQVRIRNSSASSSTDSLSTIGSGIDFTTGQLIEDPVQRAAYEKNLDNMKEIMELCYVKKPVRICVEGVFVFYLDENNLFTELKNDCEVYQEIDA